MASNDDELLAEIAQYRAGIDNIERLIKERKGVPQRENPNPLFKGIGSQTRGPVFPRSVVPGHQIDGDPVPPVVPSPTIHLIEQWKEIIFKPSMASAMLYVIMPVVSKVIGLHEEILRGGTTTSWDHLSAAIVELGTWEQLTIAQRSALEGLFTWIGQQLEAERSVIPVAILSNMAVASGDYDS